MTDMGLALTESRKEIRALRALVDDLRKDNAEWQASFDLYDKAMARGTEQWRKANPGNELVLPDTGNLVEWLIAENERMKNALKGIRAGLDAGMRNKTTSLRALVDDLRAERDELRGVLGEARSEVCSVATLKRIDALLAKE